MEASMKVTYAINAAAIALSAVSQLASAETFDLTKKSTDVDIMKATLQKGDTVVFPKLSICEFRKNYKYIIFANIRNCTIILWINLRKNTFS